MALGAKSIGAAVIGIAVLAAAAASGSVLDSQQAIGREDGGDEQGLVPPATPEGSATRPEIAPIAMADPVAPGADAADGPQRLTGLAGDNLNRAMAEAGVPGAIAQEYLRAVATRIRLADGISVQDRFDLVIDNSYGAELLVYVGLDRVGASDVQLMRWVHDGRAGWVDAAGSDAQAAAMRMPLAGGVTSRFGMRKHPILHSRRFHRGIDLKAAAGTPIRASADGRVSFAGWSGGYGRQVRIGHADGLATSYSHMSRIAAAPGALVRRGDIIGFVGSSGFSTGPHLHYEVFKAGRPVDPATVRYAGGDDSLDKQERRAFNGRLRSLLTAAWNS